jgi:hypothetical protein
MAEDSTPEDPAPLEVVVRSLPKEPHTPLSRDIPRLLSLAALIFSLSTGLYTLYLGYLDRRNTAIDDVMALIDRYYATVEKLSSINAFNTASTNLLQSQAHSLALRAFNRATAAGGVLDSGTWQSIAQINDAQENLAASESAWIEAVEVSDDPAAHAFSMQGLNNVYYRAQRKEDANKLNDIMFDLAVSDGSVTAVKMNGVKKLDGKPLSFHRSKFPTPTYQFQKYLTQYNVRYVWLLNNQDSDCKIFDAHFREARSLIFKTLDGIQKYDFTSRVYMTNAEQGFLYFYNKESECQPSEKLQQAYFCAVSSLFSDSALVGFGGLRSVPFDIGKKESRRVDSVVKYVDADSCRIRDTNKITCGWPASSEATAIQKTLKITGSLVKCEELGTPNSTRETYDDAVQSEENYVFTFSKRPQEFVVSKIFTKPNDKYPAGDWYVSLELGGIDR